MQISPPIEVTLPRNAVRVLSAYPNQTLKMGVEWSIDESCLDALLVTALPQCVESRNANEKRRGRLNVMSQFAHDLLMEQAETLEATHGANAALPNAVLKVLAAKACAV